MDAFAQLTRQKESMLDSLDLLAIRVRIGSWGFIESPFYEISDIKKKTHALFITMYR